jgi:hypothetical protein
MTYIPGFGTGPVPSSPTYSVTARESYTIPADECPMVYTTTGPLPLLNGLTFTADAVYFDPNLVASGDLDCGLFGSQA